MKSHLRIKQDINCNKGTFLSTFILSEKLLANDSFTVFFLILTESEVVIYNLKQCIDYWPHKLCY